MFDNAGNMYGVGTYGGRYAAGSNGGALWEIPSSGGYKDLHDFYGPIIDTLGEQATDGMNPVSAVYIDSSGDIFGTTEECGAAGVANGGVVWELTSGGIYRDLHDFGGTVTNADGSSGPDGIVPQGALAVDSHGNLFGVTQDGGASGRGFAGVGMVWELSLDGTYRDLHDFGGFITVDGTSVRDGDYPTGQIVFDSSGDLFGAASGGGSYDDGIVWEITSDGVYKDVHNFGGPVVDQAGNSITDGKYPDGGVVFDKAGNMFGTAYGNGANDGGIVWELTSAGQYADLHDFGGTVTNANGQSGPDGTSPDSSITFDSNGSAYGTTYNGGEFGVGVIWKLADVALVGQPAPTPQITPGSETFTGSVAVTITDSLSNATILYTTDGSDPSTSATAQTYSTSFNVTSTTTVKAVATANGYSASPDATETYTTIVATFQPGLQMFSMPYSYSGVSLDTLFGYAGVELAVWTPATSAYAMTPTPPANQISLGQGYWVRFPQAVTVNLTGTPADTTQNFDIPLTAGWNMIGNPFLVSVPLSALLFNDGTDTFAQATSGAAPLVSPVIYTYPAGATNYSTATTIAPEQGYWIFAYENTDVQVPHP